MTFYTDRDDPDHAQRRKERPLARGLFDYFPAALAEVALVSKVGNDQHNPGQPMHWARGKSSDHADCLLRHLIDRGRPDTDGTRHSAKVAWRALALLQEELEAEGVAPSRGSKFPEPKPFATGGVGGASGGPAWFLADVGVTPKT
jgi:hypothetical protein